MVLTTLLSAVDQSIPAHAMGVYKLQALGFDSCAPPSVSTMQAFWNGSSYYFWGIYIGGSHMGCPRSKPTASWVAAVTSGTMAWRLLPYWVGPQSPCWGGSNGISYNTATAFQQGVGEASSAYSAAKALGLPYNAALVYDMEAVSVDTAACVAATKSFIDGWVYGLHRWSATAGVYTSSGSISRYASIAHVPDFVDVADFSDIPSTSNIPGLYSGYWVFQQRHKQYRGEHWETWNGVTIKVDSHCANSYVNGISSFSPTGSGCA